MRYDRLFLCALILVASAVTSAAESGDRIRQRVDEMMMTKEGSFDERTHRWTQYLKSLSQQEFEDFVTSYAGRKTARVDEGALLKMSIFAQCYLSGPARDLTVDQIIAEATDTKRPQPWRQGLLDVWRRRLAPEDARNPERLRRIYALWEQAALTEADGDLRLEYARQSRACATGLLMIVTERFAEKGPSLVAALREGDATQLKTLLGEQTADESIQKAMEVSIRLRQMLGTLANALPGESKEKERVSAMLAAWVRPVSETTAPTTKAVPELR